MEEKGWCGGTANEGGGGEQGGHPSALGRR